jgi:hypothetical protein
MLFMVELTYSPQHRDEALRYVWEHGTTRYEGNIAILNVWVATEDHLAYALVESENAAELEKAYQPFLRFGTIRTRHVMNIEQL